MKKLYILYKNISSFLMALVLLVLFLPLFLVCALAIKLEDGGTVFFSQMRTGKNMRPFKCYKFRSMVSTNIKFNKDDPVIKDNNKHLTKVGRIMRKFKIDELPQLFNILKGDMYFIAPRPLLPDYENGYEEWEKLKFRVRPGLTGLGQVNGNGYLSIAERNYYDVKYVLKLSLFKDLGILFKTFFIIIFGEKWFVRNVEMNAYLALKKRAQVIIEHEKTELLNYTVSQSMGNNIESEV